jgi:antitoxin component HigA of HigAB toxin-antitoxin module
VFGSTPARSAIYLGVTTVEFGKIVNKASYLHAIERLEGLMQSDPSNPDIAPLAIIIEQYEEENWPIGKPKTE